MPPKSGSAESREALATERPAGHGAARWRAASPAARTGHPRLRSGGTGAAGRANVPARPGRPPPAARPTTQTASLYLVRFSSRQSTRAANIRHSRARSGACSPSRWRVWCLVVWCVCVFGGSRRRRLGAGRTGTARPCAEAPAWQRGLHHPPSLPPPSGASERANGRVHACVRPHRPSEVLARESDPRARRARVRAPLVQTGHYRTVRPLRGRGAARARVRAAGLAVPCCLRARLARACLPAFPPACLPAAARARGRACPRHDEGAAA